MKTAMTRPCCGCSLETGSKCIGIISLAIDLATFIYGITNLVEMVKLANTHIEYTILLEAMSSEMYSLIEVFIGCYLLYGLFKHQIDFVRTWVLTQIVFLIVSIISDVLIVMFCYFVIETRSFLSWNVLLLTVFRLYSLIVVHKYEVELRGSQVCPIQTA